MSGYRPARMSGLGAHVAGGPAFVIASLLEIANVEDRLSNLPPPLRASTLETMDDIRGAARVWSESRKAGRPAMEPTGPSATEPLGAFLTTSQAAQALGVSERRVRQLADAATLVGRKLGRRWQLDAVSVEARRVADEVSHGSEN